MADDSQTMAGPLFTVITPTINRSTLVDTLDSVPDWVEHIIVGDGVMPEFDREKYPGKIAIQTPQRLNNLGHSPRMFAWFYATGKYIIYMDDDDVFLPNAFDVLKTEILNDSDYDFYIFPAMRLGKLFYSRTLNYGQIVSNQYAHRRYSVDGQPIIFGDGRADKGHGCDGYWMQHVVADRYLVKFLSTEALVNVRAIGNGQ
jgi:glycosyltransferase involved in cell wall biosynthesis